MIASQLQMESAMNCLQNGHSVCDYTREEALFFFSFHKVNVN